MTVIVLAVIVSLGLLGAAAAAVEATRDGFRLTPRER